MKKIENIWIGAFFFMILGIPLLWILTGRYFDAENYENRVEVSLPEFSFSEIENLPAAYEAYYNDHLPFRNQLIRFDSGLKYTVFQSSTNQNVIKGKDGWLFYNSYADDNPIESYKGMNLFTQEELVQIADNLLHTEQELDKQGTEFVLFIAPNKERIYAEKLPDYYGAPAAYYRTKQLVDYLREETDLQIVYPYEELMQAKENGEQQLYYRLDTHWNFIGGYVGSQTLVQELGAKLPALTELTVTETEPTICDLADQLNLRKFLNTDSDYILSGYDQFGLIADRHEMTGAYEYHCTDGGDERTLFMVRDSFADAMADFVAAAFQKSCMVHYSSYQDAMVVQQKPDIFVYETVERRVGELLQFRVEL